MPSQLDYDDPDRYRLDQRNNVGFFTDQCKECGHSRASHLVSPDALNPNAVSDCNHEDRFRDSDGDVIVGECDCDRWV